MAGFNIPIFGFGAIFTIMIRSDITGKRFGRLLAVRLSHIDKYKKSVWFCACDCGKTKSINLATLKSGDTRSCGCLRKEVVSKRSFTHGLSNSPEHRSWNMMLNRCRNEKCKDYKNYGGRGISVCDRWKDFLTFLDDMGPRPSLNFSLDRIDTDGNYEPGNCRWATASQQAFNRRKRA